MAKTPSKDNNTGKRVTSYDVASHAGVSQSAVSRCFKPGAGVSKKTRDKIMKSANALGYEPNAIARSLISGRSNMVAIIISNLTNLYYPEVLAELTQQFSDRGIRVLLFTLKSESQIDDILQQVFQYQVDGVISAARMANEQVEEFTKRRVPLVFYNRIATDTAINSVCCDHSEGAFSMINRLVESDHKRFAIITGPKDSMVGLERCESARQRIEDLGYQVNFSFAGDYSYECGRDAVLALKEHSSELVDAVICANDMMAIGVIDALRYQLQVQVPEQVSVVGFDGIGPATWSSFDLTTIRQPVSRMAQAAVAMLMERIDDPQIPPEKRLFSGVLITGNSARIAT